MLAAFDADVDLNTAAGDVLRTPDSFSRDIRELHEAVGVVDAGGKLDRNDWTTLYVQSLCTLSITQENAPDPSVCDDAFANRP